MRFILLIMSITALLDAKVIAIEEPTNWQTIRSFHVRDFEEGVGRPSTSGPLDAFGNSGWIWQPLFDGTVRSSVVIELSGANILFDSNPMVSHLLLSADQPRLDQPTFAVVGR